MMINRLELIDKLKAKIQERKARSVTDLDRARHKSNVDQANYVAETAEAWSAFATTIRRRVRQNLPITAADVPERLRGSNYGEPAVKLFKPAVVNPNQYLPHVEGFRSLLLVLESSPDELISTSALERLGAPVRELFR